MGGVSHTAKWGGSKKEVECRGCGAHWRVSRLLTEWEFQNQDGVPEASGKTLERLSRKGDREFLENNMASNREGPAGLGSSYCFYPANQSRCTVLSSNSQTLQNSRCKRVWTEERVLRRKGIKRWQGTVQSGCSWRAAPGWVLLWEKLFFFFKEN